MTALVTLSPRIAACSLHRTHRPQPWTTQVHHVIPEAWTRHLGLSHGRTVGICPTGHDAIHVEIRRLITGTPREFRPHPGTDRLAREAVAFWAAYPQLAADGVEPV